MRIERLDADVLGTLSGICYVTDIDGNILNIGAEHWQSFAESNGAPRLNVDDTIGGNIFDFIEGEDVRNAMRQVLDKMQADKKSEWVMPYRCDSPAHKRNMRLSVTAIVEDGAVLGFLFQSVMLADEMRPPIDIFDFQAVAAKMAAMKNLPFVVMCAWCQRIKQRNDAGDTWIEAEEYYRNGGSSDVALSHSICPDCDAKGKNGFGG